MKNKRVLITGGMGFIGPSVINRLKKNNEIVVIDRLDYGIPDKLKNSLNIEFEFIKEDLSDINNIHNRIKSGEFDVIIHMASISLIPVCENKPDYAFKSNTISPLNILKSNIEKAVFLNFSTSAVYSPANKNHNEEDYFEPIDVYGWTKKHTEDLAKFYSKKLNFPVINIRLANAIGHGETNLKLFGEILSQIERGNSEIKLGNLSPRRDYVHTEDIAWAVENLIDSNTVKNGHFESFNIGTGYDPVSVKDVFELINKVHNGKLSLIEDDKRKRSPDQERELLAIDIDKLLKVLPNYKPKKIDELISDIVLDPGLRIGNSFVEDIYYKDQK
ncbi:MAG: NAD(P)-dependent oxidoreductase [Rickettsiales bacterium TMED289]|nr:MAG: NAD(P)-dependent oxidoreductase [Rickettsiales bacterium TMED289]|tara:strand:- start:726 stop:1718 length:993 start_codon:yes stop_codon:yes gene_type:complete